MRLALILTVGLIAIAGLLVVLVGHHAIAPFESRLTIIAYGLVVASIAMAVLWMAL